VSHWRRFPIRAHIVVTIQPTHHNPLVQTEAFPIRCQLVSPIQPTHHHPYHPFFEPITKDFYTLSLRMMKAVWPHVRLKKVFENVEALQHVGTTGKAIRDPKDAAGGEAQITTEIKCDSMRESVRFQ
jgi:hypothetical protein